MGEPNFVFTREFDWTGLTYAKDILNLQVFRFARNSGIISLRSVVYSITSTETCRADVILAFPVLNNGEVVIIDLEEVEFPDDPQSWKHNIDLTYMGLAI